MALFDKLFGARTLESERAKADQLFAAGELGQAKLAYDRARDLARGDEQARTQLQARADACCDALARARLEAADALLASGEIALAVDELHSAIDTAVSREVTRAAEDRLERMERVAAQRQLQAAEPQPEDRFELLAGSFEDDQYAEYRAHGERAEQALLALHDGDVPRARAILEEELPKADAPRYLWFELGRARLADGATEAGVEALRTFLGKLHAHEGGDARLLAHMELAQVENARGDVDAAVREYESALEAMPDDPRPYLALSAFLRKQGAAEDAIEVVQAGLDAQEDVRGPWRLWQELGLAHADAGHDDEAIAWLERVIEHLVSQQRVEPPAEGTLRLAQLYEEQDKPARALDLYSLLARGSDAANLCSYHEQAARLMSRLDLVRDARRMLQRALELAPDDATRERLTGQLASLDPQP